MLCRFIDGQSGDEVIPIQNFDRLPAAGDRIDWRESYLVAEGAAIYERLELGAASNGIRWVIVLPVTRMDPQPHGKRQTRA